MPLPDRRHLHRLPKMWMKHPLYFLTVCTASRRKVLAAPTVAAQLLDSWQNAGRVHGWVIGRYVIMPDHVHFFATAQPEAKALSAFIRDWKKWTTRQIAVAGGLTPPLWQPEFFDHALRSADSYAEKWEYVRLNPVRAGLAASPEAWPYSGECEKIAF